MSPNLALLGAQYSFELEGTLGAQDPLDVKKLLDKMDTILCWIISQTETDMNIIQTSKVSLPIASLGKQHLVC